jgi:hypothetical protein
MTAGGGGTATAGITVATTGTTGTTTTGDSGLTTRVHW